VTNTDMTTRDSQATSPNDVAPSWPTVLGPLLAGEDLQPQQASWALEEILSDRATSAQIASFASLMRAKGESVEELGALARTMLQHATAFAPPTAPVADVVGTGGDRSGSVNISTMAAIVVAATGLPVVKHGNRAASSRAGSADVVEALGIPLDLPADRVREVLDEVGITFCFAPVFHPAMRFAGPTRRELGIPTTFNLLGPLANPARPAVMALGVADATVAPLMAGVLAERGVDALVVRGDDGLDEITTTTTSRVWRVRAGDVQHEVLDPGVLGVPAADPAQLTGGDAEDNAEVVRRLVDGEQGAIRDVVLLNAAATLAARSDEADLEAAVRGALDTCRTALDSGAAARTLQRWVEAVNG
jgi:anthranilate phosphoribosyltransferase